MLDFIWLTVLFTQEYYSATCFVCIEGTLLKSIQADISAVTLVEYLPQNLFSVADFKIMGPTGFH